MGMTYIDGAVTSGNGVKRTVRFLIDSGATYTLLPHADWQALGLAPKRQVNFTLADGTRMARRVSECRIELPQGEGHTPVILGEPGDQPLLGAVTWGELGVVLNPFQRTLQPMQMFLS